jgi:adenine nucleotide transporter 17
LLLVFYSVDFALVLMFHIFYSYNSGTLDAILKMIHYEGFYGFYKGMSTKIVQSVLSAAVLFMIKEELVKGARFLLTKNAITAVKSKPP